MMGEGNSQGVNWRVEVGYDDSDCKKHTTYKDTEEDPKSLNEKIISDKC